MVETAEMRSGEERKWRKTSEKDARAYPLWSFAGEVPLDGGSSVLSTGGFSVGVRLGK